MQSPGVECDGTNRYREVGLERAIVEAFGGVGNPHWWNQVPVASGLYGGTAGKRRAIDLIHRRSERAFDIVELKLDSNTPLFAAVEVLEYGFAWLLSREKADALGYGKPVSGDSLLAANDILLSVLAPVAFYRKADYSEFGAGINRALQTIGARHDVRFGFSGFRRLSVDWSEGTSLDALRIDLASLYPAAA